MIRAATTADLERIQAIEVAAAELFRAIGMDAVADDPPPPVEQLEAYVAAGTTWVATDPEVGAIGYVLVDGHAGWSHIEQVTVHPHYARRGVGAALIDHVEEWARGLGQSCLSLTTFSSVPWNGPYYERLGFRHLPEPEWPAYLRSTVEREADHGLAAWPRTVMARSVKQPCPGKNHG
ncbi:GNAT family N-acetyltransferase [Pseudarthrobacter sp. C4D7]|uniref:GNAT family N-acetyltransferase n=1 Tax=Pseudarthrobacter sp. C4D7 TaxID=2735268 RepID=UPI00158558DC|nr:GNAT family N-acetyltransferase [Pseudarthrobacter sp. C4D7]